MWVQIAIWVVMMVVSYVLRPKPKIENAKVAELSRKDFPIASEAAPIPVLFGERLMKAPNVVWYGDIRTEPIKKKGGGKK